MSLLGLHTQSPTTAARHTLRDTQLGAVASWLEQAPEPAVAFGDFNVTYYSPVLKDVLGDTGARSSQLGFGMQATWPVQFRPAGIAIDQSIYTGDLTVVTQTAGAGLRLGAPDADRHLRAGRLTAQTRRPGQDHQLATTGQEPAARSSSQMPSAFHTGFDTGVTMPSSRASRRTLRSATTVSARWSGLST